MSEKNTPSRDGARSRGPFGLGPALGVLAAFIVARRLWARRRMPQGALWRRVLAEKRGEILVANVVRELAEGKDFLFADRGEAAVKGFDEPVRLFEVRWREQA
jgi:hypothetical protein